MQAPKLNSAEYAEAVRFIFSNADFSGAARRYQKPAENWVRFEMLLQKLGRPLSKLKALHVAGTNGKGTTSALVEAGLRASGERVGLFTSPHLHSWRERIRLDGSLVSKEAVVDAMRQVRPAVEELGYASPFEKLSALAFVCFASAGIKWAVLETGLGGRWDCTNHCTPVVCAITRVGLDHMNVLGNDVATIAGEKAGIIKPGVPVFSVPQEDDALAVITAAASEVGAPLVAIDDPEVGHPFWLSPRHQQLNASLAASMLGSLAQRGLLADDSAAWRRARSSVSWPGRFETFTPSVLGKGSRTLVRLIAPSRPLPPR